MTLMSPQQTCASLTASYKQPFVKEADFSNFKTHSQNDKSVPRICRKKFFSVRHHSDYYILTHSCSSSINLPSHQTRKKFLSKFPRTQRIFIYFQKLQRSCSSKCLTLWHDLSIIKVVGEWFSFDRLQSNTCSLKLYSVNISPVKLSSGLLVSRRKSHIGSHHVLTLQLYKTCDLKKCLDQWGYWSLITWGPSPPSETNQAWVELDIRMLRVALKQQITWLMSGSIKNRFFTPDDVWCSAACLFNILKIINISINNEIDQQLQLL